MFGVDLYKGVINPQATDRQAVRAGQIFALVVIPISVALVLYFKFNAQEGLFDLLINFASVTNVPLISIMVVAISSRRTPAVAANVALAVGMAFQFYFGVVRGSFFGISGLHVAGVNFLLLAAIMLVFRVAIPKDDPGETPHSGDVDITPWKFAKPVGLGLTVLIAAIYLGLHSQFGLTPGKQVAAEYESVHPKPVTEPTDN